MLRTRIRPSQIREGDTIELGGEPICVANVTHTAQLVRVDDGKGAGATIGPDDAVILTARTAPVGPGRGDDTGPGWRERWRDVVRKAASAGVWPPGDDGGRRVNDPPGPPPRPTPGAERIAHGPFAPEPLPSGYLQARVPDPQLAQIEAHLARIGHTLDRIERRLGAEDTTPRCTIHPEREATGRSIAHGPLCDECLGDAIDAAEAQ